MSLVLVTPPASEPITLAEAKAHLRVDDAANDDYITALIPAARQWVETHTGLALLEQEWQYSTDRFPCWHESIKLGKSPLISVESVRYVDTNGVTQLLAADQYLVDTNYVLGRISPAFGAIWPATRCQPSAIQIAFTAGYDDVASIPSTLIAAMKLLIGDLYVNRESSIVDMSILINPAVMALLDPWRLPVV